MSVFDLSTYDLIIKAVNDCKVASIGEKIFREYLFDVADDNLRAKMFLYFVLRNTDPDINFYLNMYNPPVDLCKEIYKIIKEDEEYVGMSNLMGHFITMADKQALVAEDKVDYTFNTIYELAQSHLNSFDHSRSSDWKREVVGLQTNTVVSDQKYKRGNRVKLNSKETDFLTNLCKAIDDKKLSDVKNDLAYLSTLGDNFYKDFLLLNIVNEDVEGVEIALKNVNDKDFVNKIKEVLEGKEGAEEVLKAL